VAPPVKPVLPAPAPRGAAEQVPRGPLDLEEASRLEWVAPAERPEPPVTAVRAEHQAPAATPGAEARPEMAEPVVRAGPVAVPSVASRACAAACVAMALA
jgi:hypothetical protein